MKKLTLFVCALAVTLTAFAGSPRAIKTLEMSNTRETQLEKMHVEKERPASFKAIESAAEITARDTLIYPYYAPTFHGGSNTRGIWYYSDATYITPLTKALPFANLNPFVRIGSWVVNDQELAKDSVAVVPLDGNFDFHGVMPKLQALGDYQYDDTTMLNFPDYQYGATVLAELLKKYTPEQIGNFQGISVAPWWIEPLCLAAPYSEDPHASYAPNNYGTYGARDGGSYWYGTQLVNKWTSTSEKTTYFDTTAVFVSNPDVMYIDHITLGAYTDGQMNNIFPGENDHIRLTLYPVNAKGLPDWNNPIVSATANQKNVIGIDSYNWNGFIQFNFLDEDPITHNFDTVPAIVEGDFWAVLDEYNDGTANFGFLAEYDTDISETYFFFNYPGRGLVYTQKYNTPANLFLNFHAILPTIANAPKVVSFKPGDELTKVLDFKTNVWGEDMELDTNVDWIDIEAESVLDIEGYLDYAVKFTIKVEESTEKREGTVYINALGKEYEILVKQNDDTQGINNIKAVNDNKRYNVLGQEVSEDYKGVVIRNGEKFVR